GSQSLSRAATSFVPTAAPVAAPDATCNATITGSAYVLAFSAGLFAGPNRHVRGTGPRTWLRQACLIGPCNRPCPRDRPSDRAGTSVPDRAMQQARSKGQALGAGPDGRVS